MKRMRKLFIAVAVFILFAVSHSIVIACPVVVDLKATPDTICINSSSELKAIKIDWNDYNTNKIYTWQIAEKSPSGVGKTASGKNVDFPAAFGITMKPGIYKVVLDVTGTNSKGETLSASAKQPVSERTVTVTVGEWVKQKDVKAPESLEIIDGTKTPNDKNIYSWGSRNYDRTLARTSGYPYSNNYDSFQADVSISGASWKKSWKWFPSDRTPCDASFRLYARTKLEWEIDGNCNNSALSAAYAKTSAHSQVLVESYPGTDGDYVYHGDWKGEKREGDTFSGALNLSWPPGITLTWNSDPTDEWQCGPDSKERLFLQNLDNDDKKEVSTEIVLFSESHSAADKNAYHAISTTSAKILEFKLTKN